ncbi:MAG: type II toxin-antitoxin system RelE/ParE family toxin [Deltaproteobacteria bacterium]|nr:MAG: type II toxin-antitoxin system RelE/ParE family toxin [Deltaproteobacteria bacterium]
MKILQSGSFERKIRKFSKQEKAELDRHIQLIMENSSVGKEKKGDLRGVFVHKFRIRKSRFLLAYRFAGDDIELIMIGPHENYYRDLKQYLKNH